MSPSRAVLAGGLASLLLGGCALLLGVDELTYATDVSDGGEGGSDSSILEDSACPNGGGLQPGAAWPMFGGCPTNAGRSAFVASQPDAVIWTFRPEVDGGQTTSVFVGPVIDQDETLYYGVEKYPFFYAVRSGAKLQWNGGDIGSDVTPTSAIGADGIVYAGGGKGLVARRSGGTIAWVSPDGGSAEFQVDTPPAIDSDGTVYFGTQYPPALYAIAPLSGGMPRWKQPLDASIFAPIAIDRDRTVYAAADDGVLRAFAPDGSPKGTFDLGGFPTGAAIASDGTVYVGTRSGGGAGVLYALGPGTLTSAKWTYDTKEEVVSLSPTVGLDGNVYVLTDRALHAVDPNGIRKWRQDSVTREVGTVFTPVVGADGTIYVASKNVLYAISRGGSIAWTFPLPEGNGNTVGHVAIGRDGTIYVLFTNGTLIAVK